MPVPAPKPLLARALLDGYDPSRRKARFTSYYMRVAGGLREHFPWLFENGILAARRGFVRAGRVSAVADPPWQVAALSLASLETWLRAEAA